jgi:hypothetical protein
VNIATEKAPDPEQADRMLALILDGLRPQPGAVSRTGPPRSRR